VICELGFFICDLRFVIFYLVPISVPINRKIKNDRWKKCLLFVICDFLFGCQFQSNQQEDKNDKSKIMENDK